MVKTITLTRTSDIWKSTWEDMEEGGRKFQLARISTERMKWKLGRHRLYKIAAQDGFYGKHGK